jgi:hypothetical protein
LELRAIALFDLGLSGLEFGRNNHRTLGALMERLKVRRVIEDFRAGQICSIIANSVPRTGNALYPQDFFPSLHVPRTPLTPSQVRAKLRGIRSVLNA